MRVPQLPDQGLAEWRQVGLIESVEPYSLHVSEMRTRTLVFPPNSGHIDYAAWTRLYRLDITCNFYDVSNPARYLRGLEPIKRPYGKTTLSHGTLASGSKSSGWFKLYDKHLRNRELAPRGTMRAELQAKRPLLGRHGLKLLADVTPCRVRTLFLERAKWFGLEREVMTTNTAARIIAKAPDLSPTVKVNLMNYVFDTVSGEDTGVTPRTAAKYNALLSQHQLSPYLERVTDKSVRHLDVRSHREIKAS